MDSTVSAEKTAVSQKNRSFGDYIGLVLRGVAMGASDIVPGVSGGTMAFILGIYQELIDSIRTFGRSEFIQAVIKFRVKEIFEIVNWKFLLAIIIGIFTAIITLASVLESLLVNQPIFLWSFFFGLVIASVFVVSNRVTQWNARLGGLLVLGAAITYFVVGLVPVQTPEAWWFLLLCGAIASCALILPGISGAFLLVLLGKYQFILGQVNTLREGDLSAFLPLAFVGIGAVVGLVSFAQLLGWLFKQYADPTIALLIGLMLGSLRKIWPWREEVEWLTDSAGQYVLDSEGLRVVVREALQLPALDSGLAIAIGLMLVGFTAVFLLDRLAGDHA